MSDVRTRVLSGVIMGLGLIGALLAGAQMSLVLITVIGLLVVDELLCNFLKIERFGRSYFCTQLLFLIPYLILNLAQNMADVFAVVVNVSAFVNFILLIYLFFLRTESAFLIRKARKYFLLVSLFVLLPLSSIASLLYFENWRVLIGALITVSCAMDIGAWFFGINFGRHKLMPQVSPKKTVEGLVGGVVFAGLIGLLYCQIFMKNVSTLLFFIFGSLALSSQIGDLVQSKIKREAGIKDSSSLIPGHGGVYDRIDSVIFVAPFYAIVLRYYHF